MSKPCYPRLFIFRLYPLMPNGLVLSLVVSFFSESLTWIEVCFVFNRHSFEYHASTSPFMCGSRGRCLVINSSYHTYISFIISPLFYNITYSSWLATSYNCPFFTISVCSYHWQFIYPFASMPLWEWTYSNPLHTSRYYRNYCFGEWSTCSKGGLPPFLSQHPMTNGYLYHKRRLMNFDGHCHCWPKSHRYGSTNINDDNTCSNDGCLWKDMIIHQMNTKWWFHSPCYWEIWVS